MADFTPGPWHKRRVYRDPDTHEWFIGTDDKISNMLAIVFAPADAFMSERDANARLIAAAPDLYEALALLRDRMMSREEVRRDTLDRWVADINAALAKAEGRDDG